MERAVHTSDGRALAVEDVGDPAGRVVLVHVGTPNSRHLYRPWVADAAGRGLRLIGYDRPGYGRSTPCPGYSIADCAGHVRAICAALEIDRLAMWGISGGGPYPLACAALLPDLVAAAASLASPAPYEAEGLDWFAGMEEDDVNCDHEGLAPGSQGWWDDACAHVRAWGFELSDISVPVLLLHGRQDKFVPFSHGQWLAAHIPGAEAWLSEHL